jgi:hypothetical protein
MLGLLRGWDERGVVGRWRGQRCAEHECSGAGKESLGLAAGKEEMALRAGLG